MLHQTYGTTETHTDVGQFSSSSIKLALLVVIQMWAQSASNGMIYMMTFHN